MIETIVFLYLLLFIIYKIIYKYKYLKTNKIIKFIK